MTTLACNAPRLSDSRTSGASIVAAAALALAAAGPAIPQAMCSHHSGADSCGATSSAGWGRAGSGTGGDAASRPFHGFLAGRSEIHPTVDPIIYTGGAQAAGIGTQIGAFTKVTDDVVDVSTGWTVGAFTMMGAAGDQITGVYEGFVLIDLVAGTLSWVLDATITGGTGRFAGAVGAFVFEAAGEFVVMPGGSVVTTYTETFHGAIEY